MSYQVPAVALIVAITLLTCDSGLRARADEFISSESQPATQARVSLAVYYEALSNESIEFFRTQLNPTIEKTGFSEKVKLTLVPYGKSEHHKESDGTWNFTCQNGLLECYGNAMHACAVTHIASQQNSLGFVTCLLEFTKTAVDPRFPSSSIVFPTTQCATDNGISDGELSAIKGCYGILKTNDELAAMGDQTNMLKPSLAYCPWIVYDGVFNQTDQDRSLINFKDVLCEHISSSEGGEFEGCATTSTSSAFRTSVPVKFSVLATAIALFYLIV